MPSRQGARRELREYTQHCNCSAALQRAKYDIVQPLSLHTIEFAHFYPEALKGHIMAWWNLAVGEYEYCSKS